MTDAARHSWAVIKRLILSNFGPFEKADISLDDFTTILGRNGAGKSIIFTALRAIGRIARHPLRLQETPGLRRPSARVEGEAPDSRGGGTWRSLRGYPTRTGTVSFDELVHRRDPGRVMRVSIEFATPAVRGTYEVGVGHWTTSAGVIVDERLDVEEADGKKWNIVAEPAGHVVTAVQHAGRFRTPRFSSIPGVLYRSRDPEEAKLAKILQIAIDDRVGVYRFDPTALKTPAEPGRALSATGYNFATHLDRIRNDPGGKDEFEALLTRFRDVCPHVEDVLLPFVADGSRKRVSLAMTGSSEVIPADLESDGTILMLAYASLLHGARAHETLCIEEPENGLHPEMVPKVALMLRAMAQPHGTHPPAQVLVCTHSRQFFDQVKNDPSKLRLVRRSTDGQSSVETTPASQLASLPGWAGLTT